MTTDGKLLATNIFRFLPGENPKHCPRFEATLLKNNPSGSPDNTRYVYATFSNVVQAYSIYGGDYASPDSKYLANLKQYVYKGPETEYAITPLLVWLADNRRLVFFDLNTHDMVLFDSRNGNRSIVGNFPSPYPAYVTPRIFASPRDPLVLVETNKLGPYNIHLVNIETGQDKNLTMDFDIDSIPGFEWSPDGSRIALTIPKTNADSFELIIMDQDGGIIKTLENATFLDWSPDGKQILFGCNFTMNVYDLCLSNQDGNEVTQIEHPKFKGAQEFNWSPDQNKLVYYTSKLLSQVTLTYHVLWLDTGEDKEIVSFQQGLTVVPPQWSPDSRWLLFTDAGPTIPEEYGIPKDKSVLLCNLDAICKDLNGPDKVTIYAEWSKPRSGW